MRAQLGLLSIALPLIPYIVVFMYGDPAARVTSLAFMGLSLITGVLGMLRGNPLIEPLITVVFMSLILALSSGYLVYVTHVYVLYVNPMGLTTLGYSIGFVELAVVASMMLRMYNRLYSELVSKGYSEEEVKGELSEYVKHMLMISSAAFVASVLVYLAFSLTAVSFLDPITALVIFLVVYVVLIRYTVRGR